MKELKRSIRRNIKASVAALGADERGRLSEAVTATVEALPEFDEAKTVLCFWSLPDEVCTHEFCNRWHTKKRILLPVVVGDVLELRLFRGEERMATSAFGIKEPVGEAFELYGEIDLALIPGVSFDLDGHRLGRGKGYYDKLLPLISAKKIGLCFPVQITSAIPTDSWDIPMDAVVTAK